MAYKANFDLTRVRALPFDVLRQMFPRTCILVTGKSFVRSGGFHAVADTSDDSVHYVPNGRRVEQCGRTFTDYTTALNYARRVYGDREHYQFRILIPEIDCPGEA